MPPLVDDGGIMTAQNPTSERMLTPPQVARRLGVSADKIHAYIRNGELRAYDLATRPGGRPRYHIEPTELQAFLASRAAIRCGELDQ